MDQCEVKNMISEKGKCVKIIKGFKFSLQNKLAFDKQQWNCTTKICKTFLKVGEYDEVIFNENKLNHKNCVPLSEQVLKR